MTKNSGDDSSTAATTGTTSSSSMISKRIDEAKRSISSLQREVQRRVVQWSTVDSSRDGGLRIPWTTALTTTNHGESSHEAAAMDSTMLLELSELLFSRTSPRERLEYVTSKAAQIEAEIEKIRADSEQAALRATSSSSTTSTIPADDYDELTSTSTYTTTSTSTNYPKCLEDLKDQCHFLRQCQEITTILDTYHNLSSLAIQAQELQRAKSILEQHLQLVPKTNSSHRRDATIVSQLQSRVSRSISSLKQGAQKIIQQNIIITKASIQVITQKSMQRETTDNARNYGNLKEAWECLLTLSSTSFGCVNNNNRTDIAQNTPLHSILWELTSTLQNQVMQPLLEEFQSRLQCHSINGSIPHQEPTLVTVHQGTETNGKTIYCRWEIGTDTSSSSSSSSNTYHIKKIHPAEVIFNIQQQQWNALTCAIQSIFTFFFYHVLEEITILASHVGKLILFLHPLSTTTKDANSATAALEIISKKHHQKLSSVQESLRQIFWEHCFPNTLDCRPILQLLQTSPYDHFINAAYTLEEALKKNHYLPQEGDWFLTTFVKDFPTKYCEKKRVHVLMQARKIIMQSDYHTAVPVGIEDNDQEEDNSQNITEEEKTMKSYMSIFHFPKCAISIVAQKILDLVRETMKEAAEVSSIGASLISSPKHFEENDDPSFTSDSNIASCCSQQLFLAARECFDIFRAVIPSLHRKDLYTLPRSAAIFHNDCTYFAHACTTLGLEFADQMTTTTPICTFVDMIPVFRELGNNIMMDMIKRQRHETLEILASHQIINGLLQKSLRMNEVSISILL
jgi:hypothetical protein